ncbi:MAG TPA: alpha/beta fold hydrolase [Planktothrix sp.]
MTVATGVKALGVTVLALLLLGATPAVASAEETTPTGLMGLPAGVAGVGPASGSSTPQPSKPLQTQSATSSAANETAPTAPTVAPAVESQSIEPKTSDAKSGHSKSTSASSATAKGGKKSKTAYREVAPCLSWIDYDKQSKAVILCVHGLGLHNGTYTDFGKRMSSLGYAMYAIDMPGFGSFQEAQGRQKIDFVGDLEEIKATLKVLHRAHPGLPVFILGESMGGAIALRACAIYPDLVDGLISSVPSGDRFKQGKTDLKVAIHFLEGRHRDFNVGKGVVEQATVKPELREAWGNDPLARMNLSAEELMQFQHFMNQNHVMAKLIKTRPVLFVQGCKDKLVRPEGTVQLFNQLATPDRQLELISSAEHLIFEENQFNDEAIDTVSKWLDKHIASTPTTGASVSIAAPGLEK